MWRESRGFGVGNEAIVARGDEDGGLVWGMFDCCSLELLIFSIVEILTTISSSLPLAVRFV